MKVIINGWLRLDANHLLSYKPLGSPNKLVKLARDVEDQDFIIHQGVGHIVTDITIKD